MHGWIALQFGYEGNPYADEPRVAYAYDDNVQNHKRVAAGDILFIRGRDHLEGIGRIENIEVGQAQKSFRTCPRCRSGRVHHRKTLQPPYKCNNGHEFDEPSVTQQSVRTFRAVFERSWLSTGDDLTAQELRPFELRQSAQLAIMPVDLEGLVHYIARRRPEIGSELVGWLGDEYTSINDGDADIEPEFTPTGMDERERIVKGIRLRRGQAAFRNRLIERYGSRCLISGCRVLGVLEAAHIRPYRGPRDNHPGNGLLLRSDLHTLFDLNRIAIDPDSLRLVIHSDLEGSEYAEFKNRTLLVTGHKAPDKGALQIRWREFVGDDH